MSSEDESPLKCFNKTPKPPKTVPDIEMTSQRPESQPGQQSSKIDWMRQQMTQMQAMMEQIFRTRPIDPAELE